MSWYERHGSLVGYLMIATGIALQLWISCR